MDERTMSPTERTALDTLRTDVATWPDRWKIEQTDVAIGQRIVECLQPFLIDLRQHGLAEKTLARHRDHLDLLGGELIRRRYDDPDLARHPVRDVLGTLIDAEGGPLIWPRITEGAQNAFDGTCRKLYHFLNQPNDCG